ncbi:rapA guanosine triphosphatase-activating protein 1-like isoform X2 [Schistocerca gregaria]|uniref:rapA guanosine triphosphatase-activating protein 1-like isoform X2 n=1 Tax=Schistocerca gregaria TaxID=7010 RepID=UPI00211E1D8C|nr:rapA guanosine triphosphatase-activating protein 1-like isoform X2 [Schistocerca gregaria]
MNRVIYFLQNIWSSIFSRGPKDSDDLTDKPSYTDYLDRSHSSPSLKLISDQTEQFLYDVDDINTYFPGVSVKDLLIKPEIGYRVEVGGRNGEVALNYVLEDAQSNSIAYYQNTFSLKKHANYIGGSGASPVLISVMKINRVKNQCNYVAIVRTKYCDKVYHFVSKNDRVAIRHIQNQHPFLRDVRLTRVKNPLLVKDLVHIEDRLLPKGYKFGVIYAARESDENLIFSNNNPSDGFLTFMKWLGKRIKLKGWKKFGGGLDLNTDTTGTHSYFTAFQNFDIMFHVSTELPYSDKNGQQVERKRHIGNDIVIIIYQDGLPDHPFEATSIKSKFNQVYFVVQEAGVLDDSLARRPAKKSSKASMSYEGSKDLRRSSNNRLYKLAVVSKQGVKPYGPTLPRFGHMWKLDITFKNFLLTKLINAERAAYYTPEFAMTRTRRLLLKEILDKY